MAKIKITQVKSDLKRPGNQRRTIKALGLGKINRTVEVEATPQILGMVNKVSHLVSVSEYSDEDTYTETSRSIYKK